MMFWIFITLNTILYGLYCYLGYQLTFKESPWFIPACLALAISGNVMWLIYVKVTASPNDIFIGGVIWDSLLTASFVIVPFLFCNVKLSKISIVGLVICIIGLGIMKSGDLIQHKIEQKKEQLK